MHDPAAVQTVRKAMPPVPRQSDIHIMKTLTCPGRKVPKSAIKRIKVLIHNAPIHNHGAELLCHGER